MNTQLQNNNISQNTNTNTITNTMMPKATTFNGRDKLVLPSTYKPTNDVVIIGRGKKIREHVGNQQFYGIVDANLTAYQNAATKGLKSSILWNILTQVRANSQHGYGFVKKEGDSWCAVDDSCARINIAQAFRDRLSYAYKSSKQHKSVKRKYDLGLLPAPQEQQVPEQDSLLNESILANMVKFDLHQERPSKRACLPSPATSSTTATAGSLEQIQSILQCATQITFDDEEPVKPQQPQVQEDVLSCLLQKFGGVDTSDNPFEPKPIEQTTQPVKEISSSSLFPMTASSCLMDTATKEPAFETLPVAAAMRRASMSLSSFNFNDDVEDGLLDDCFEMVNALWGESPSAIMSS